MLTFYKETCQLCNKEQIVSEYDEFGELEVVQIDSGQSFTIPKFPTNKIMAKEYFESIGWQYIDNYCICKNCEAVLKKRVFIN